MLMYCVLCNIDLTCLLSGMGQWDVGQLEMRVSGTESVYQLLRREQKTVSGSDGSKSRGQLN